MPGTHLTSTKDSEGNVNIKFNVMGLEFATAKGNAKE